MQEAVMEAEECKMARFWHSNNKKGRKLKKTH